MSNLQARFIGEENGQTKQPGDLFYRTHDPGKCWSGWSNCDGKHLYAILPNGSWWDIDSRCSNCSLPNDTTHRCWCRTGEPPNVTVGKRSGPTCDAGAGSVMVGNYPQAGSWHGFLEGGFFIER